MRFVAAVALLMALRPPAFAGNMMSTPAPTPRPANLQIDRSSEEERAQAARQRALQDKLMALRGEGLKLREADGGTLTAEHRAYLQAKLDALNAEASAQPAQ